LNSKTNPDLLSGVNLQVAKNVDYYSEYGTVSKFKGATRVTSKIGGGVPVTWIGFYKAQDFAGQILRETIYQAGTKMYQKNGIASDELTTENVQTAGIFRDSDMFNRFMLITGQSPYLTGDRNDKFKYDGFKLSRWGVSAPGREETIIEPFTSKSGFTATQCVIDNEASIAYRGGSQKCTVNSGNNTAIVEKFSMTPFSINDYVEDRCEIAVYIPEQTIYKLKQGLCLQIYFGQDNGFDPADSYVWYNFYIGDFQPGWNILSMDFSIYPDTPLGGSNNPPVEGPFDCIKYIWSFNPTYIAETPSVYMDHLVALDQGTPFVNSGSPGTVFPGGTGAIWSYVVTYENQYGHESNRGVELATLTGDASTISENLIWGFENKAAVGVTYEANVTEDDDTAIFTEGKQSIEMDHDGTSTSTWINIGGAAGPFDLTEDIVGNNLYVDVYISTGNRAQLATDGLRVQLGTQASVNYWEWRFNSNTIEEDGWTTLTIDMSDPDIINGEVDLSAIVDIRIIFEFKATGIVAGAGELKVDNLRTDTVESWASWELTAVPVSSDPDVNKRHIYRTVANGTTHFYVGTIYDNATTTFSDTISDSSLGVRQPPSPGQFADNSIPPDAGIVKTWKQTVFMAGDPKDPNVLYFSRDELPEAFPLINGFELDSPITGMFETNNGLVVTTDNDWWRVIGDNPDYYVDRIKRGMGNVGYRACGETRMYGWAHDTDCIRLFDLNETNRFSEPIQDKLLDLNKTNLKDCWSIYSKRLNGMLFFYANASGAYDTCYMYQHPMDNVNEGNWSEIELPTYARYNCGVEIEDSNGIEHLYVGSTDGAIFELGTATFPLWMDADANTEAVTTTIQTIYLRAGALAGQTRGWTGRWKPSFIEMRCTPEVAAATSWTVTVDTGDGPGNGQTVRDSQDITIAFPAGRTLQRVRLKDLISAEYCRIKVVNNDVPAVYSRLNGIRLYVAARPSQFPVTKSTPGGRS
jgi:hypothetical protein